jgi:hypothetical protein
LPQIHIDRLHGLTLSQAKALALAWAKAAQDDFGMQIEYASDPLKPNEAELLHFKRTGAHGTLRVTPERFVLEVWLGFLLGNFKDSIEAALLENLKTQLAQARS